MVEPRVPLGRLYHESTKITWSGVPADQGVSRPVMPPPFREYAGPRVPLLPAVYQGLTLEEALRRRRSVRQYAPRPLTLAELGQLCFAAQGVTGQYRDRYLRTAPSAGALYPFELYPVVHRVEGLEPGVYHYNLQDHSLTVLDVGDFRQALWRAGLEQEVLAEAGVVFVLAAVVDRVRFKYGERGWRYVYMEAGHISQNIYLQATSLGLGSVAVGAFFDDEIHRLVGMDGQEETAIYLHAVGAL